MVDGEFAQPANGRSSIVGHEQGKRGEREILIETGRLLETVLVTQGVRKSAWGPREARVQRVEVRVLGGLLFSEIVLLMVILDVLGYLGCRDKSDWGLGLGRPNCTLKRLKMVMEALQYVHSWAAQLKVYRI